MKVLRVSPAERLEASPDDSPAVPKSQLGDRLPPTAFGSKPADWASGGVLWRRGVGITPELCRQER